MWWMCPIVAQMAGPGQPARASSRAGSVVFAAAKWLAFAANIKARGNAHAVAESACRRHRPDRACRSPPAQAQNWPTRPVKFIVPFGPGAGADIGARLFAEKLSQKWGQPVVIENKPGGDSIVAIQAFLVRQ